MNTPTTNTSTLPSLYRLDDVAKALGVRKRTISRWVEQGHLSALRIGPRSIRISEKDLHAFLDRAREAQSTNCREAD